MERYSRDQKGEVFIRTIFGEVSECYFWSLTRIDMIKDEEWRIAAGVEDGPFCYTDDERLIPF